MGWRSRSDDAHGLIVYDGRCGQCLRAIEFLATHDVDDRFMFAPMQSDLASALLAPHDVRTSHPASLILLDGDTAYARSSAAVRIAWQMRWPWRALTLLIAVPSFVRDPVYGLLLHRGQPPAAPDKPSVTVRKRMLAAVDPEWPNGAGAL